MRDSEYNANEHLANATLRRAGEVIDRAEMQRYELSRDERRHCAGAKAIGMLSALIRMGELPEHCREQAQRLISEWER